MSPHYDYGKPNQLTEKSNFLSILTSKNTEKEEREETLPLTD